MRLWFGEHKDKDLREVPTAYLKWLLNDTQPDIGKHDSADVVKRKRSDWQDLLSSVEDELERREDEGDHEDDDDDGYSAVRF